MTDKHIDITEFETLIIKCKENVAGKPLIDYLCDEQKLQLYGIGLQGSLGNNNTDMPEISDSFERKKWEAWNLQLGKRQDDAKIEFIKLHRKIFGKK